MWSTLFYSSRFSSGTMKRAKDSSGIGYSYGSAVATLGTPTTIKSPSRNHKLSRCACKDTLMVVNHEDVHLLRTTSINNSEAVHMDHIIDLDLVSVFYPFSKETRWFIKNPRSYNSWHRACSHFVSFLCCFFYMTMWLYPRLAKVITNNVKIYLFNINPSGLQWLFISWVGAFLVLALRTRWKPLFRTTWTITEETYSLRFTEYPFNFRL